MKLAGAIERRIVQTRCQHLQRQGAGQVFLNAVEHFLHAHIPFKHLSHLPSNRDYTEKEVGYS